MRNSEPTHRITHADQTMEAFVYIAPSLQEKLDSPNPVIRKGAEDSVSINYREACRSRHGTVPSRYVSFDRLEIEPIERTSEYPLVPMTRDGQPAECDECPSCESDFHERCHSGNCPQAQGW